LSSSLSGEQQDRGRYRDLLSSLRKTLPRWPRSRRSMPRASPVSSPKQLIGPIGSKAGIQSDSAHRANQLLVQNKTTTWKMLLWLRLLANLNYSRVQGHCSELGSYSIIHSQETLPISHRPRLRPRVCFLSRGAWFSTSPRGPWLLCVNWGQYYPD